MRSLLLLAALSFLVGCNGLEGQIEVLRDLQILKNGKSYKTMPVATYEVEVKNDAKKNRLTIRLKDADGDSTKFRYTYPAGFQFPQTGEFAISAEESNQMFDLEGENTMDVTRSQTYRGNESCSLPPGQECYYDQWGRPYCRPIQRWGIRYVEYQDVTTTHTTEADLIEGESVVATLTADRTETFRDYIRIGFCR